MFFSPSTCGFYSVVINGDNIPNDAVEITSEQYAQLLADQSLGATILLGGGGDPVAVFPPPPVPVIPTSIRMRQCRLQLIADGVYATVNTAVEQMPLTAQVEWEYAATIDRSNPLVPTMQALLGWDDARVDQFYTEASNL